MSRRLITGILCCSLPARPRGARGPGVARLPAGERDHRDRRRRRREQRANSIPRGVAVDPVTHDMFLAGMFSEGRLHKWDGKTGAETVFGREDFFGYFGMVVDPNNHDVYALNATSKRMEKYFPSGKKGAPAFFATEANGNPALGPEGHFFIPKSPGKFENTILPGGEGGMVGLSHGGETARHHRLLRVSSRADHERGRWRSGWTRMATSSSRTGKTIA